MGVRGARANRFVQCLFVFFLCLQVSSCSTYRGTQSLPERAAGKSRQRADIPRYHWIVRGETLFAIAWRYGLDHRELAVLNRLEPPYTIYAGRRLLLKSSGPGESKTSSRSSASGIRQSHGEPRSYRDGLPETRPVRTPVIPGSRRLASGIDWHWPVRGPVSASAPDSDKVGVEIAGQDGAAIRAAAPGEVVYSGDRLIGYGKLIIIRHNDEYLSAYAHNRRLLVPEGFRVSAGQQIAEMGNSGTDQSKLYFEIRRNGKPVPPLEYLP